MAASTQLITDLTTASGNTPNATTLANATAAAGPILDVPGNLQVALTKMKEAKVLLQAVQSDLDAADPSKTVVTNVLLSLV